MADNPAHLGALAHRGHEFVPYAALAKYPYKYIERSLMQPVSNNFFANGLLRERGWTLFYLHTYGVLQKPLLLVPALEVEALIYDMNKELGTYLRFPHPSREPGFLLNFDEPGSARPRYLGRVDKDITVEEMESKIPGPDYKAPGETDEPEDGSFEAFKAKMEAAIQAGKNKSKSQKERKKKERVVQKRSWCAQLKRAQCYLGVRPCRSEVGKKNPQSDASLGWDEMLEAQKVYDLARCVNLPELDITSPVPYSFSRAVVFVCVDIEAWEKDHKTITEIGVCTLDTNDLISLPPGEDGKNWMTAIRPRHFRIFEYQHLVNSDFVAGCADRFEKDFGTSEFIASKDAPQVIASCFKPPFSADFQMASHNDPTNRAPMVDSSDSKRNIILVGHDIKSDISFMRDIGYDVSNLSNVLEAIDTADMHKALKQEQQSVSLGRVLLELGMTGWNLHNAGNDAAYTLQSMIGLAFGGLRDKKARQAALTAERQTKLTNAAQDAQDRIKEEGEEWSAVSIDDSDGGVPISIPKPVTLVQPTGFGAYKAASAKQPQPPKPNAAARRAMAEKEAKKQWEKEEAEAVSSDGNKGVGKGQTNGAGEAKKERSVSIEELVPRFKSRLGLLDGKEGEGEGDVKV